MQATVGAQGQDQDRIAGGLWRVYTPLRMSEEWSKRAIHLIHMALRDERRRQHHARGRWWWQEGTNILFAGHAKMGIKRGRGEEGGGGTDDQGCSSLASTSFSPDLGSPGSQSKPGFGSSSTSPLVHRGLQYGHAATQSEWNT